MGNAGKRRSDRFLNAVDGFSSVLIVMHDTPDPDAIAAGWGLFALVQEKVTPNVRLIGGGGIVRAENREMVKLLRPPLELIYSMPFPEGAAMVLVDCGPDSKNHLFACHPVAPVAVIDHHAIDHRPRCAAFQDVRPTLAASASIVASYLREQGLRASTELATAMLYAIRTETSGSEVRYSRLDRSVILWLTERADPTLLAQIENAPLPPEYFGDMALALQGTFIYGDTALCLLPRANGPEIVGEVADLLIRCEGIRRVLCGAVVEDDLLLSVRTERNSSENAAELARRTLAGLGHGGGHQHRAGGKISAQGRGPVVLEILQDELLSRWLITCGISHQRGRYLIPRQEIVDNL